MASLLQKTSILGGLIAATLLTSSCTTSRGHFISNPYSDPTIDVSANPNVAIDAEDHSLAAVSNRIRAHREDYMLKRSGRTRLEQFFNYGIFTLGLATGGAAIYSASRDLTMGLGLLTVGTYGSSNLLQTTEFNTIYTEGVLAMDHLLVRASQIEGAKKQEGTKQVQATLALDDARRCVVDEIDKRVSSLIPTPKQTLESVNLSMAMVKSFMAKEAWEAANDTLEVDLTTLAMDLQKICTPEKPHPLRVDNKDKKFTMLPKQRYVVRLIGGKAPYGFQWVGLQPEGNLSMSAGSGSNFELTAAEKLTVDNQTYRLLFTDSISKPLEVEVTVQKK
ncbi:MAG: hypothetical protein HQM06_15205 [Magnetococcales bacterium]|nr:hypothetical protein [Magnetococcales bacterium]